jgi:peptidoglycan/LPS O-acetylase OafA/YrhL
VSVAVSDTPVKPSAGARTYLPGLDGVRALAVVGVLLYHCDLAWFQGGFLGVDVFFVLSGFLITGLLAHEVERTGGLDIRGFYVRRLRRLVPALILLLVATLIGAAFLLPDAAPRVRSDIPAALFYFFNWRLIVTGQSYFEFISRPPLLQHLWSLAIEEQFYLLWPICALGLMRWGGRRRLGVVALLLALASTGWMTYLSILRGYPDEDPSRIYFGTDTHCMGLLLGAALAAVWQPWRPAAPLSRRIDAGLAVLGVLSCAGVAYAYVEVGDRSSMLYRGGFLLLAAIVCSLIVSASHPGSRVGRMLGRQPLRWIGERSYGLYLWHWPIFVVTRPGLDVPIFDLSNVVLRFALTVAATEISFRLVERPIREGALGRFVAAWRLTPASARRPLAWRAVLAGTPAFVVLALAAVAIAKTPPARPGGVIAADVAEAMGIAHGGPTKVTIERFAAMPAAATPTPTTGVMNTAAALPTATSTTPVAPASSIVTVNNGGLTAVGDSVLLGARVQLEKSIRGAQTDAEVGRQAAGLVERLRELHADHLLAPTVLVHLGTNGYVTENQLRRSLKELADRDRVIVVNAHAPRIWVTANNEMIARVLREYPNAVLLDWASVSTMHPEFFASDDIHLTPSGQQAFVSAVIQAGGFPAVPPPLPKTPRAAKKGTGEGAAAQPTATATQSEHTTEPADGSNPESPAAGDQSSPSAPVAPDGVVALIRHPRPMPLDQFWDDIAECESGGKWTNPGKYSGGLGIYVGSWEAWGGREFAASPAEAAPKQQVIVANRISTQGWARPDGKYVRPVGFGGWGCVRTVGMPALLTYTPESVLGQHFSWSQHGEPVRDLQAILGLPRDGVYGRQTWVLHIKRLEALQLPRALAPANPPDAAAAILATR